MSSGLSLRDLVSLLAAPIYAVRFQDFMAHPDNQGSRWSPEKFEEFKREAMKRSVREAGELWIATITKVDDN